MNPLIKFVAKEEMNCFDKFHCGLDLQRLPRPSFFFSFFFFCFCCSTSFFFLFIDLFLLPNIWPINTDMQMNTGWIRKEIKKRQLSRKSSIVDLNLQQYICLWLSFMCVSAYAHIGEHVYAHARTCDYDSLPRHLERRKAFHV